jgi:hypothetical protein
MKGLKNWVTLWSQTDKLFETHWVITLDLPNIGSSLTAALAAKYLKYYVRRLPL